MRRNDFETISTGAIRAHYDRLSIFYRWLWGEHIHHGFWRDGESPREAQLNLVKELAERARIRRGAQVLDVGCGLGAAALWLARELDCRVTGITISPVQRWLAQRRARALALRSRVQFLMADANNLEFPSESFDALWVIECSEHLFDKQRFVWQCARLLRAGGVLALCSWLRGNVERDNSSLISEICSSMLCPSLPSLAEYRSWMMESGLEIVYAEEIPGRVAKTWQLCESILERPMLRICLPLLSGETRAFAAQIRGMQRAFASGVLSYGMFAGRKR